MRPLEIIIPALLSAYLLWRHPRPVVIRFAPALALALTLIHFWIEGYRWQMIPIYVLTALLGISALIKIQSPADWKPLASYLTFGLLVASTALPLLLPIPVTPTPSGPYQVGTRIYELTDISRKELYSGKASGNCCASLVLPSISVKRNVTVPVGRAMVSARAGLYYDINTAGWKQGL